jgi:HSP20 family protein
MATRKDDKQGERSAIERDRERGQAEQGRASGGTGAGAGGSGGSGSGAGGSASGSMMPQRGGSPMRTGWGISPWEPWGFRRMFEDFDRMFEEMRREFFGERFLAPRGERSGVDWTPRLDVEDTGRELVVLAELPGVDPKDVHIECTEDGLTISGERREEQTEEHRSYRSYGRFFRQISLPSGCNLDKADASFKSGLLRVRLPKPEPANVRRIPISTEGGHQRAEGGPQLEGARSEVEPRLGADQRPGGGGQRAA